MQNTKNPFKDHFIELLSEGLDDPTIEGGDPEEEEAFNSTLDDSTEPSDYDINPNSFREISKVNIGKAEYWVEVLGDFAKLINSSDDEQSLAHFLNRVDREGSAFRGIVRSQGKRVTRIAEEASAMAEVLKSHIVGSEKKERELLQQFPNLKR